MGIFTVIGRKVLSMKLQASSTQIKTVTVSFTMYLFKKKHQGLVLLFIAFWFICL